MHVAALPYAAAQSRVASAAVAARKGAAVRAAVAAVQGRGEDMAAVADEIVELLAALDLAVAAAAPVDRRRLGAVAATLAQAVAAVPAFGAALLAGAHRTSQTLRSWAASEQVPRR